MQLVEVSPPVILTPVQAQLLQLPTPHSIKTFTASLSTVPVTFSSTKLVMGTPLVGSPSTPL